MAKKLAVPESEVKLIYFVDTFVCIYDGHFKEYINRLNNRTPKEGKVAENLQKCAENLCGTTEIFEGGGKAVSLVGLSAITELASSIGKRRNRNNTKRLIPHLEEYKADQSKVLNDIIRSAVEIFISFQRQFLSVTTTYGSWETALNKLGEDAVKRSLQYYRANPKETLSVQSITKGVVQGKSPKYANTAFTWIPPFTNGHTVQRDGRKIKTPKLFQDVDTVLLKEDGSTLVSRKNEEKVANSGIRLAFDWEDVKKFESGHITEAFDFRFDQEEIQRLLEKYEENKGSLDTADRNKDLLKKVREDAERDIKIILQEIGSLKKKELAAITQEMKTPLEVKLNQTVDGDQKIHAVDNVVAGIDASGNQNVQSIDLTQNVKGDLTITKSKGVVYGLKL